MEDKKCIFEGRAVSNCEFDELPMVLTMADVQAILGVGRNTAFNVFHMNNFPRLEIMKRNLVLKTSFIEWFNKYVEDTQNEKHSKTSSKK